MSCRVVWLLALMSAAASGQDSIPRVGAAPAPAWLVVLNKSDGDVSWIDPETGDTAMRVPVGVGPHEAATSPDGTTVVVCNYGDRAPGNTLSVLDGASKRVSQTIDLGEFTRPQGIQFLPDGKQVVVTSETRKTVIVVDLASAKVTATHETAQDASHMVALAPDAARAYVANIQSGSVSVLDLVAGERLANLATGRGAEGIAVHPQRPEVWVTNRAANTVSVVDTEKLEVSATLPAAVFPIRVAFTPGGQHALVSCAQSGEVVVFDVATQTEVRRIEMERNAVRAEDKPERLVAGQSGPMPIGILVEEAGRRAFVANTFSDMVSVIDLETWKVTRQIRTGRQPDGMAWVPAREAKK